MIMAAAIASPGMRNKQPFNPGIETGDDQTVHGQFAEPLGIRS